MTNLACFLAGMVGVLLLNAVTVFAAHSMETRIWYLAGTTVGSLLGMTLGSMLTKR